VLRGTLEVDVAIVGGGITGAICAYLFSAAGIRVALLEANESGRGSTAASTALLMQEPDRDFRDLADQYGFADTRRIWHALRIGTRDLIKTIRTLKIDCELSERKSIYFTRESENLSRLKREFRDRKRAGLPGRWLSAERLHKLTGIEAHGAIVTNGNAELDPLKACAAFLRRAEDRGAAIFERTPVRRISTTRSSATINTPAGAIVASYIVVATGYATREFKPLIGRFRMMDTYVVATRRLPKRVRRRLLREHAMLWDTERPYHYLRWTDDNRLLLGGEDTPHRSNRGARAKLQKGSARLLQFLATLYPDLGSERPAYTWKGLFAETPDGLPYIGTHRRYPRHLFALGYGGNGMTASFLAAQMLLKRYLNSPSDDEALFAFSRRARR
jgi:glycine/D-amino acid oxidase-like deaminating enzyme